MRKVHLLGLAVATALALSACTEGEPEGTPTPSASVETAATPYLPVPSGVELTRPGSQLNVGDHAVVAYEPRQDLVGVLDIQVVRLEKASIKDFSAWQLTEQQKKSTPYYVRSRIENVGDTDLGGRPVPLYIVNEKNVLLEATPFASSFEPCPSTPFPKKFGPGKTTRSCLVYLAPNRGQLEAVSFRPEESFNPITWDGDIEKYQPPKPEKPKKGKKSKNSNKSKNR